MKKCHIKYFLLFIESLKKIIGLYENTIDVFQKISKTVTENRINHSIPKNIKKIVSDFNSKNYLFAEMKLEKIFLKEIIHQLNKYCIFPRS